MGAIDYHDETVATYRRNVEGASETTTICSDVKKISAQQLAKISKIDGFAYGFPCNDFSLVGEHNIEVNVDKVYPVFLLAFLCFFKMA